MYAHPRSRTGFQHGRVPQIPPAAMVAPPFNAGALAVWSYTHNVYKIDAFPGSPKSFCMSCTTPLDHFQENLRLVKSALSLKTTPLLAATKHVLSGAAGQAGAGVAVGVSVGVEADV